MTVSTSYRDDLNKSLTGSGVKVLVTLADQQLRKSHIKHHYSRTSSFLKNSSYTDAGNSAKKMITGTPVTSGGPLGTYGNSTGRQNTSGTGSSVTKAREEKRV